MLFSTVKGGTQIFTDAAASQGGPSQGAWLTGDLTNHNTESTILSVKQIKQESRLTSVDLNFEKCCVLTCIDTQNSLATTINMVKKNTRNTLATA